MILNPAQQHENQTLVLYGAFYKIMLVLLFSSLAACLHPCPPPPHTCVCCLCAQLCVAIGVSSNQCSSVQSPCMLPFT